jgi:hypothetical protein
MGQKALSMFEVVLALVVPPPQAEPVNYLHLEFHPHELDAVPLPGHIGVAESNDSNAEDIQVEDTEVQYRGHLQVCGANRWTPNQNA